MLRFITGTRFGKLIQGKNFQLQIQDIEAPLHFRSKKVVKKIQIPAEVCSSVSFGGKNLDTLFVTTGQRGFDFNTGVLTNIRYGGQSGSVFMVKGLNAKGFPRRRLCL